VRVVSLALWFGAGGLGCDGSDGSDGRDGRDGAAVRESASAPAPAPAPEPEPAPEPVAAMAERFELAMVGDIIFGRYRPSGFDRIAGPGENPFEEIDALLVADLTIGNLETPLVPELDQRVRPDARFRFGATAEMATHLESAGFDALSIANNHFNDQRESGLEHTPRILEGMGIAAVGATQAELPAFRWTTVERSGWRVGLLAATIRLNMPLGDAP